MEPTTLLILGAFALFGPKPKLFQPKPDTAAIAAAQAEADTAKAAQSKAEAELAQASAQLAAIAAAEAAKRTEILTYGQETNDMAAQALALVPLEHRTAEVELAAEMVGRTGVSLATILGQLRPDQRADLIKLVHSLLSKQAAEREAARVALAAKDAALAQAAQDRAVLLKEGELLKAAVQAKEADVQLTRAERDAKDIALRAETDKALRLMDRLRGSDGAFWRLCLWAIAAFAWFRLVLPALAHAFPAFAWLQRFNAFVFHLLTGSSK